jgi:hypothetical protein
LALQGWDSRKAGTSGEGCSQYIGNTLWCGLFHVDDDAICVMTEVSGDQNTLTLAVGQDRIISAGGILITGQDPLEGRAREDSPLRRIQGKLDLNSRTMGCMDIDQREKASQCSRSHRPVTVSTGKPDDSAFVRGALILSAGRAAIVLPRLINSNPDHWNTGRFNKANYRLVGNGRWEWQEHNRDRNDKDDSFYATAHNSLIHLRLNSCDTLAARRSEAAMWSYKDLAPHGAHPSAAEAGCWYRLCEGEYGGPVRGEGSQRGKVKNEK